MQNLQKNDKRWIVIIGGIYGFTAVALGAFGAHALKAMVTPERLATWQTAIDYQMFHSLALIAIYLISLNQQSAKLSYAAIFQSLGVLVFSGSLFLLVLTDTNWLGMITPIGGVFMLLGWLILISHFIFQSKQQA